MPLRAAPLFDATENATDPLPVPDAPLVIVIHDAFADAVHVQVLADAVTAADPVPPPASTF